VHQSPDSASERTSECLFGELLTQIRRHDDNWLFVRCVSDGYEGYVSEHELCVDKDPVAATHWVHTRSTVLFAEASIKSAVMHCLPFQSRLRLTDVQTGPFTQTSSGHYVWTAHTLPVNEIHPKDPIAIARSHFLAAPYIWGGRSTQGLDCSGLVQALASARGISIPRDSGDQEVHIEQQIDPTKAECLDLVFWPGHVGILVSPNALLNATAHHLSCLIEPLDAVVERAGKISSVRRLFS
jgi:cell wall-associated NlpC family hydrolase